jgi:hypothetical protein
MPGDRDYAAVVSGRRGNTSPPLPRVRAGRGSLDISDFSPGRRPSPVASRMWVGAMGAVASCLLHLTLLTTAIWVGGQHHSPSHQPEGVTAFRDRVTDEIALQWVTIDASANPSHQPTTGGPSPPPLTPIAVTAELPELADVLPPAKPDTAHTSVAADDSNTNSQLRAQYLGQITARIDRAWMRPRAPIGDASFICQVRIEQDAAGNVTEVALERCNGSALWQVSLVHAIESASPLPTPPDPSVFAHAIHMSFEGVPIDSAASAEQYEHGSENGRTNGSARIDQGFRQQVIAK